MVFSPMARWISNGVATWVATRQDHRELDRGPGYEQADGAVAHVARLGDTYNVVVVGERGVVTGVKGVTEQGLGNLARNYGWTGFS